MQEDILNQLGQQPMSEEEMMMQMAAQQGGQMPELDQLAQQQQQPDVKAAVDFEKMANKLAEAGMDIDVAKEKRRKLAVDMAQKYGPESVSPELLA